MRAGLPDPDALAAFYSALLGLPVTYREGDWIVVAAGDVASVLAFQHAPGNEPPTWPRPRRHSRPTSTWS
jgi:catechol-2,3-dioxygenase